MPRRIEGAAGIALAIGLVAACGCSRSRPQPQPRSVIVGRHRVVFVLPEGWEHLDHGRQQLFRRGDVQLSLRDLGPADLDSTMLALQGDTLRRELDRRDRKRVHAAEWTDVRTWDRVSHSNRSRFTGLFHDGSLLVFALDLGPYEQAEPGFDALLGSFRVTSDSTGVPGTRTTR